MHENDVLALNLIQCKVLCNKLLHVGCTHATENARLHFAVVHNGRRPEVFKSKKNSVSSLCCTDTMEIIPGARSKRWSSVPFFSSFSTPMDSQWTFFTSSTYLISSLSLHWYATVRINPIESKIKNKFAYPAMRLTESKTLLGCSGRKVENN